MESFKPVIASYNVKLASYSIMSKREISLYFVFNVNLFNKPHECISIESIAKGFICTRIDADIFNCYN